MLPTHTEQVSHEILPMPACENFIGDVLARLRESFAPGIPITYHEILEKTLPVKSGDSLSSNGTPNDHLDQAVDYDTILFVGGESLTLTNLLMTHSSCEVRSP